MGVLAPVSAHAGPSAHPPIGTSGNFPAHVSAQSISPNFTHFPVKIGLLGGVGGVPQIFFSFDLIPNIFVTQEPMLNSQTVAQNLLGGTVLFGFCPPKIGFFRGVPEIFFFILIFIFQKDHFFPYQQSCCVLLFP